MVMTIRPSEAGLTMGTLKLSNVNECQEQFTSCIHELRRLLHELRALLNAVDMLGEKARNSGLDRFQGASQCRADDIWWAGIIRGVFGVIAAGSGLSKSLGQDWMEALKVSNDVGGLISSTAFDSDGVRAEGRSQYAMNNVTSMGELLRAINETVNRTEDAAKRAVSQYLQLMSMQRR